MKKCKVLYVGITGNVGGIENFICNIAENLDRSIFEVDFLVHQTPHESVAKRIDKLGHIILIKGIKKNPVAFFRQIFSVYKENFDIVHLNECSAVYSIYVLPLLLKRTKTKLIVHSHNGSSNGLNRYIHYFLRNIQNHRADEFWACSKIAAEWMFKDKKYDLIRNGIDVKKYEYNENRREEIRKELRIGNECVVVGSVGRFEVQKNHTRLLDIFNEYHKINNNSCLVLVGDGSLKSQIEEKISKLSLSDSVILTGLRNDIPNILSSFDIFLMPSFFEGLPFVGIEAQANGLPVLFSSSVSEELLISDKAYHFNLGENDMEIATRIQNILESSSRNEFDYAKFKKSGFDLIDSIHAVEKKYLSLVEEDVVLNDK